MALISPMMIGGTSPRTIYTAPDLDSAEGVPNLKHTHMERIDDDYVWLRYDVVRDESIPRS